MELNEYLVEIIIALVTIFFGGAFISYKISKSNRVNQKNIKVGKGDVVGGDKTVTKKDVEKD